MSISVMRYARHKKLGDTGSPMLTYLKRVPGRTRTYTTKDVAEEAEALGALSTEDVVHAMNSFVRSLRKILVKGDKVKIEGLGTFFSSFNCNGSEDPDQASVRNIRRVNVRFAVDNTLRLVNDANASTRGAANNVEFALVRVDESGTALPPDDGGDDGGGDIIDPDA